MYVFTWDLERGQNFEAQLPLVPELWQGLVGHGCGRGHPLYLFLNESIHLRERHDRIAEGMSGG